jgi:putative protein-disulfide isomerase
MKKVIPIIQMRDMQKIVILLFVQSFLINCQGQNNKTMSQNTLICNPDSGVCEMPRADADKRTMDEKSNVKAVRVIYFTDPICSSCWGIEPQLRKLKLEYGYQLEIEYHMGGLLPDWSYNSGGISKPGDVAHHWDEVSVHYDMPIDGDVWLEDPLSSSYPPSIAFKAAEMQDKEKALLFLRELREMVFLRKKNIAKWEHITNAAQKSGLDLTQLKTDYGNKAQELFKADLQLAGSLGVRGFPTLFFVDSLGNQEIIYGSKPYSGFEAAILKLNPSVTKKIYEKDWKSLFAKYHSLTAREFSELSGVTKNECLSLLDDLTAKGVLKVIVTKNGKLWMRTDP